MLNKNKLLYKLNEIYISNCSNLFLSLAKWMVAVTLQLLMSCLNLESLYSISYSNSVGCLEVIKCSPIRSWKWFEQWDYFGSVKNEWCFQFHESMNMMDLNNVFAKLCLHLHSFKWLKLTFNLLRGLVPKGSSVQKALYFE